MADEEKRVWGIHTKDDNLFLQKDVIAIDKYVEEKVKDQKLDHTFTNIKTNSKLAFLEIISICNVEKEICCISF